MRGDCIACDALLLLLLLLLSFMDEWLYKAIAMLLEPELTHTAIMGRKEVLED